MPNEQAADARVATIVCADGTRLAGRLFEPHAPEFAVVLHGATGVPRDYYARFARWLSAERNAAVLIYDYRDCGESATVPVREARTTMGVWGVEDQGAALGFLCERYPDLPIEAIGHSLGGLFANFHPGAERIRKFTAIASGPAHWSRHPVYFVPMVFFFWFAAGPLLTQLFGFMPGRAVGVSANLPRGVYWQWRRWCISRPFYRMDWGRTLPVPDLERLKCPLRLIAISDDPMIPPPVVWDLAQFYPHAQVERHLISPEAAGVGAIGHLRAFSERSRAIWPVLAG